MNGCIVPHRHDFPKRGFRICREGPELGTRLNSHERQVLAVIVGNDNGPTLSSYWMSIVAPQPTVNVDALPP